MGLLTGLFKATVSLAVTPVVVAADVVIQAKDAIIGTETESITKKHLSSTAKKAGKALESSEFI